MAMLLSSATYFSFPCPCDGGGRHPPNPVRPKHRDATCSSLLPTKNFPQPRASKPKPILFHLVPATLK